jgi:hypothetical protein
MEENQGKNRLIPLTQWNEFHPWPNQANLRYYVFHAETNGFKHCVRKIGKRILILEPAFFEWVEMSNSMK